MEVSNTLAQKKYPGMRIGYTGLSALLWETGVLGVVCVLGMFLSAFLAAGRLATHHRRRGDSFHTALFEGLQAAIAVLTLSLAHKNFFVVHLPYQAIVYLLIGFVANASLLLVRQQVPVHEVRNL
jgi:phosphatidylserine synthase